MTYTLTVNADTPGELADLLSHLSNGHKPVKSIGAVLNGKEGDKAKEEKKEEIKVTKEMVRELTAEKVRAGESTKAKVKAVLKKYNAANAALIPDESLVAFYNDLKAL